MGNSQGKQVAATNDRACSCICLSQFIDLADIAFLFLCFLVSLNQFRLLRVVGKGAFGKVRIVEKKDTGLTFALKYIRKEEGTLSISLSLLILVFCTDTFLFFFQWSSRRAYGISFVNDACSSISTIHSFATCDTAFRILNTCASRLLPPPSPVIRLADLIGKKLHCGGFDERW